jgi:hypothetical protein
MTDQDVARNLRAVAHAIGQQELEGLTVPALEALGPGDGPGSPARDDEPARE